MQTQLSTPPPSCVSKFYGLSALPASSFQLPWIQPVAFSSFSSNCFMQSIHLLLPHRHVCISLPCISFVYVKVFFRTQGTNNAASLWREGLTLGSTSGCQDKELSLETPEKARGERTRPSALHTALYLLHELVLRQRLRFQLPFPWPCHRAMCKNFLVT